MAATSSGSRRDDQIEELEGFVTMLECFTGAIEYEKDADPITGKIRIEFPPLEKRISICATVGNETRYRSVGVLSPCILHFSHPPEYPGRPPEMRLECAWMDEERLTALHRLLSATCEMYADSPMLYSLAFQLREEACRDLGEVAIHVDETVYAREKGLNGETMLKLLVDESEAAEQKHFDQACHDCEVCCENEQGSRCIRFLPCGHVFCRNCVSSYFDGLLKTEAVRAFECLSDGCSSLADQHSIRRAIGEEQFERYEAILLERALGNMEDMEACPRMNCGAFGVVSPFNRSLACCDACGLAFCTKCRRTYHGMDQCWFNDEERLRQLTVPSKEDEGYEERRERENKEYHERAMAAMADYNYMLKNCKPCPKCRAAIEKSEGCNKVVCRKCSTPFCWVCNSELNARDPYKHFREPGSPCFNKLFEMGEGEEGEEGEEEGIGGEAQEGEVDPEVEAEAEANMAYPRFNIDLEYYYYRPD